MPPRSFVEQLWQRKDIAESRGHDLQRTLTLWSLVSLGVGSVVGAGIFVITGQAAAKYAGPALSLSFVLSSIACFLSGLCYAELSAAIPLVGSSYTFAYVCLGEGFAWVVGLCLTLEYLFSASAVAVGWGASVQALLREVNVTIPVALASAPLSVDEGHLSLSGSVINVPAVVIIAFLTMLISRGVKDSATFNHVAVITKLSVLSIFVCYGIFWAASNWSHFAANMTPFVPPNEGSFGRFGVTGIIRGAGAIFFAYLGFDTVCAVAMECKAPERDVPRGLFLTLVICTLFYVLVTVALTGMVKYTQLNVDAPVIEAVVLVKAPVALRYGVEIGSIAGLTSVCLTCLLAMPRVILAGAADALLPEWLAAIHPEYKTPYPASLATGAIAAAVAGVFPLDFLGELISFGTLVAFISVCVAVVRLRQLQPDLPRPFKVPYSPYVPYCGIVCCVLQLFSLPPETLLNFVVVLLLGGAYYYFSARYRSRFYNALPPNSPATPRQQAAVDERAEIELRDEVALPPEGEPKDPPNRPDATPVASPGSDDGGCRFNQQTAVTGERSEAVSRDSPAQT